jgi:hypothetical protein
LDRLAPHLLAVLSRWRDDVWWNMLDLLGAASAAECASVVQRMDENSEAVGETIARYARVSPRRLRLASYGLRQRHAAAALAQITRRLMRHLPSATRRRPSPRSLVVTLVRPSDGTGSAGAMNVYELAA